MDPLTYEFKSEFARKYVAIGEERGEARGAARGRAEGRAEGQRKALKALLERKFGALDVAHEERLEGALGEELERWLLRVLDAATLADVFVD